MLKIKVKECFFSVIADLTVACLWDCRMLGYKYQLVNLPAFQVLLHASVDLRD